MFALAVGVGKAWRWTHEDMSVAIGLDAIGQLGQARIGHDFGPPIQVKPGLRLKIRKLDRDGHAGKIQQKWKKGIKRKNKYEGYGGLRWGVWPG